MTFQYLPEINRVLPVLHEGDPLPSDEQYAEGAKLEAALRAKDPRVGLDIDRVNRAIRVYWLEANDGR